MSLSFFCFTLSYISFTDSLKRWVSKLLLPILHQDKASQLVTHLKTQFAAIAMQYNVPNTIALHTGNPVLFLYTPTSLLPEHSVLTDVQQATGRNGQQWITCRSGGQRIKPEIQMGSNEVALSTSTANSAIIGLSSQLPNGLYRCFTAQSQRQYFSLFLRNSGKNLHYSANTPNSLACKTHWQSVYKLVYV